MKTPPFLIAALVSALLLSACAAHTPAETPKPVPLPTASATVEPVESSPAPKLNEAKLTISNLQQMKYSPILRPNDHGEYFWQIVDPDYGYPVSGGSDFILAHACEGEQVCIGDQLRELNVDDVIIHKGEKYQIVSKEIIMKDDLQGSDIWFHDANRIVLITCVIEGRWQDSNKNEVLIAIKP